MSYQTRYNKRARVVQDETGYRTTELLPKVAAPTIVDDVVLMEQRLATYTTQIDNINSDIDLIVNDLATLEESLTTLDESLTTFQNTYKKKFICSVSSSVNQTLSNPADTTPSFNEAERVAWDIVNVDPDSAFVNNDDSIVVPAAATWSSTHV